jgi:hypothetical protein
VRILQNTTPKNDTKKPRQGTTPKNDTKKCHEDLDLEKFQDLLIGWVSDGGRGRVGLGMGVCKVRTLFEDAPY